MLLFPNRSNLYRYVKNNSLSLVDPLGKGLLDILFVEAIKQQREANNDPGNILAVFDNKKSSLTLFDRETGETLVVKAFAGGGSREVTPGSHIYEPIDSSYINDLTRTNVENYGAIPAGRYEIFRYNEVSGYGYRLDRVDSVLRDDKDQVTGRSGYRLHPYGNSSAGCVTVKDRSNPQEPDELRLNRGAEIKKFIERKSKSYDDNSPISFFQFIKFQGKIQKYGELIVR